MDHRVEEIRTPTEVVGVLITIGDEILLGDIPNGNAHHIALELRARGFRLDRMVTVGDREEEIVANLLHCIEKCDFLIVTGGLGPTDDDRTNSAVSKAFERPLVQNNEYMRWLKNHLASYGLTWSEQVARMAILPDGAVKMRQEMAGFFLEHRSVPCYFLPGVPHEMRTLLDQVVIPDLEARFPDRSVYLKHVLRVQGLFESQVNERLKDMACMDIGVEIGYLPQMSENWVTLFVAASSEEDARRRIKEVEDMVIARLGSQHIIGHNDECLEMVIGCLLRERKWRLAVAESCTGGLLASRITAVAGASDYFDRGFITYSNRAKVELLKVPEELLREHGAVSEPVAGAMAQGAREEAGAEAALAVTGIAGPTGGTAQKPVGTVFIACATLDGVVVEEHRFQGARSHIQENAAQAALVLLWRVLSGDPHIYCH